MPYIEHQDRLKFLLPLQQLNDIISVSGISNGELNYLFSQIALMYQKKHGKSYNVLSDVIKAFECAKLEYYRKVVAPYEDKKAKQNGDIY